MLVVSRKQNQSVVFPGLGIRVEILRISGKTVRVGIKAPDEIQILRGELDSATPASPQPSDASISERHELRNRMNKANLAMKLLQKQLAAGKVVDAEESLSIALETFDEMEKSVGTQGIPTSTRCLETSRLNAGSPRKRALLVEDDPNEPMLLASYLRARSKAAP